MPQTSTSKSKKTKAHAVGPAPFFQELPDSDYLGYLEIRGPSRTEVWSPGFSKMLGYPEEIQIQDEGFWVKHMDPTDLGELILAFQQHMQTSGERPYHAQVRHQTVYGKEILIGVQGQVKKLDAKGNPILVHIQLMNGSRFQQNHQELGPILDALSAGYWQYVPEKDFLGTSDQFERLIGMPKPEIGGVAWQTFLQNHVHPDESEALERAMKRHIDSGVPLYKDIRVLNGQGTYTWFQFSGKAKSDSKGNVHSVSGLIQNIHSTKLMQVELTRNLKLFRESSRLAKVGGWGLTVEHGEMIWSDAMFDLFDRSPGDPPSFHGMLQCFKKEDREQFEKRIDRALLQGLSFSFEAPIITERGNQKWLRAIGRIDRDRDEIVGLLGAFQDITEEKEKELEIRAYSDRQRLASRAAAFGVWDWDLQEDELMWDDESYNIFGVQKGEFKPTYRYWIRHVLPEDRSTLVTELKKAKAGAIEFRSEFRITTLAGEVRYVQISGVSRRNEHGKVLRITGVLRDTTERNQRERALTISEEKFRKAFESSGHGMVMLDGNGIVINANPSIHEMLGYATLEGQNFVERVHPEDLPKVMEGLNKLLNQEVEEVSIEKRYLRKNGTIMWGAASASYLSYEGVDVDLVLIQIQDISSRKRLELDLKEKNQHLEHHAERLRLQNNQLEDFNHIISHNFRAPLANMNALLGFIKESQAEKEKEELMVHLRKTVVRLNETFDDLVEVVKINRNTQIPSQSLKFKKVFDGVSDLLQARMKELNTKITTRFEVEEIVYPKVYLESILLNFLSNALNYASPDRDPVIEIATYSENGNTLLTFKDNGRGMDLNRHGARLFKLNKTLHDNPDSKGVGLFMTKTHIESQGGEVTVVSEVGEGSTFIVNFDKFRQNEENGFKESQNMVGR